jgi:hypothetical protein
VFDSKIFNGSDSLLFASIKSFLSFFEGSIGFFDFTGSEFEFIDTFSGLSFIELVVGELFSSDVLVIFIKDSSDGVHWTSVFDGGFNLSHDSHNRSFRREVHKTWVFFVHLESLGTGN